jgi:hypothetical protein
MPIAGGREAVRGKGQIWVLGVGAYGSRRLPVGVADRMGQLDAVFTIIREPRSLWLPHELGEVEVIRLDGEFTNRRNRLDNYLRIAGRVLDRARVGGNVAYFTYGSPVVFDSVVSIIASSSRDERIDCRVIPATSSIDALLAFIGEDIAPGLQICEARWLVRAKVRINPLLATLLFQPGVFATDGIAHGTADELAALAELREYLRAFYSHDHPVLFVRAPFSVIDAGYLARRTLDALEQGSPDDLKDTSLYLPAAAGVKGGTAMGV